MGEREKDIGRERKEAQVGRRETTGARSYPQIQKIPQLCRVRSKAQFSVSADLLGSRHYPSDTLAVLGGSSSR